MLFCSYISERYGQMENLIGLYYKQLGDFQLIGPYQ